MSVINKMKHQELVNTLLDLKLAVDEMKKHSNDAILIWHKNEVEDWLNFLKNHNDIEELHSLEEEVSKRFLEKYEAIIEPDELNNLRLNTFKKFITQLNDFLH